MAVDKTPVLKRCRSLDLDPTFLGYDKKSKRTLIRRSRKLSEYGRNYYEKADKMKGMTGENLMTMLESRLDNVVFRMGFARTRREARQVVGHKHIFVNGRCINLPSYRVKAGDVVEVKESSKSIQRFKDIMEVTAGRLTPEWIAVDKEALKGTVSALPRREQIDVPVDEMLIVELYSK